MNDDSNNPSVGRDPSGKSRARRKANSEAGGDPRLSIENTRPDEVTVARDGKTITFGRETVTRILDMLIAVSSLVPPGNTPAVVVRGVTLNEDDAALLLSNMNKQFLLRLRDA